jgi:hypothetical protein
LTQGLTLDIKNRVKDTCNQMKGIIENATESSLTTNTSQFQEQIKTMGLENVEAVMTNVMEEKQFMPSGLSKEVREQFKDKVFVDIANVIRNVKITTFINEDGTSISLIDVSYTIDHGDFAIEIPKTVAATADEIQGNFEVLIRDPVLLFNDVSTIEFGVEAETNNLEGINEEIKEISISKVEDRQQPTPPEEEEGEEEEETPPSEEDDEDKVPPVEEEKGINWGLWLVIIILLIGLTLWIILRKKKVYKV